MTSYNVMTSFTTDSYGTESVNESVEITQKAAPLFIHPYTKICNDINSSILKHMENIHKGYTENIKNLQQEYYSQLIEVDALNDYLKTYKNIWFDLYGEHTYEEPIELKKIITDHMNNLKSVQNTLQIVEKEYSKYLLNDYIKARELTYST